MRIFSSYLSAHSLRRSDSQEPRLTRRHYLQSETRRTKNLHFSIGETATFSFLLLMLAHQSRKDIAEKTQKTSHHKPKEERISLIGSIKIARAGIREKVARMFPSFSAIGPRKYEFWSFCILTMCWRLNQWCLLYLLQISPKKGVRPLSADMHNFSERRGRKCLGMMKCALKNASERLRRSFPIPPPNHQCWASSKIAYQTWPVPSHSKSPSKITTPERIKKAYTWTFTSTPKLKISPCIWLRKWSVMTQLEWGLTMWPNDGTKKS